MIVATAGHIDHGKTALVRALTGIDTDRLPEERSRGITIDLGFAYQPLAAGGSLGFIDVPGHERLVRTMLAGAIGVDAILLVVAADDGPMPQTLEHLAILDLLGIGRGVVALTKTDRVDAGRVAEVAAAMRALLRATPLARAPVVPCSTVTGEGVAELAQLLHAAAGDAGERPAEGRFRLAVDRSFTLPGAGLIVTGTVHAGRVAPGDRLVLSPAGREVRVRGLRAQNVAAESAAAGQRCALNIAGARLGKDDVRRGDWVLAPAAHAPASRIDVRLRLLPSEGRPLRHWTPVHAHLGAADVLGRVSLLEGHDLQPGEAAFAQLVLDAPVGALWGDRFILRDQSAQRTLGGGRVLDPFPPLRGVRKPARLQALAALARPDHADALAGLLAAEPAGVDLDRFALLRNLDGAQEAALTAGGVAVVQVGKSRLGLTAPGLDGLKADVLEALAAHQARSPDSFGMLPEELARSFTAPFRPAAGAALRLLADAGEVRRFGRLLRLLGHEVRLTVADENLWQDVREALDLAALDPPRVGFLAERLRVEPDELRPLLDRLSRLGWLLRVSKDYHMLPEIVARLAGAAERVARESGTGLLTVGRFREATGIGRHATMPVLEFFDRVGFTRRTEAGRSLTGQADNPWPEQALAASCEGVG